jgi:hypothetical protein
MLAFKKRARTATDSELMLRAILKGIVIKINAYAENIYCDEKKITPGGIFGLFPQYTESGEKLDYGVQMDWMISGNLDLLEFSYFSDKYEGNVKGLHRTQLMVALFKNINITYSHTKGIVDIETKELISDKVPEIIDYLNDKYNFKITRNIISNYHSFISFLEKNLSKKEYNKVLTIYFKILSHTRADIPNDLHDDWRRINKKEHFETKFLPDSSLLKESQSFKDYLENILVHCSK